MRLVGCSGIVNLGSRLTNSGHEDCPIPLPRTPIPTRNHQLCRVGLSPFLYEFPGCQLSKYSTGVGLRGVLNGDLSPPLPVARPRRSQLATVDDSWISISVGQRETGFARHRGWTESAEPVGGEFLN